MSGRKTKSSLIEALCRCLCYQGARFESSHSRLLIHDCDSDYISYFRLTTAPRMKFIQLRSSLARTQPSWAVVPLTRRMIRKPHHDVDHQHGHQGDAHRLDLQGRNSQHALQPWHRVLGWHGLPVDVDPSIVNFGVKIDSAMPALRTRLPLPYGEQTLCVRTYLSQDHEYGPQ